MRPLRIGAERATHCDSLAGLVVAVLCRGDRVGRDTLLDPTLKGTLHIEHVWAGSALALAAISRVLLYSQIAGGGRRPAKPVC